MSIYKENYFNESIFDYDYRAIAGAIFELYAPTTCIDVGCGPGHLTAAMAELGVSTIALDGFSVPSFESPLVVFNKLNLNDQLAVSRYFEGKRADIALCLEVVEHLNPDAADHLVKQVMEVAPIVIFSAAIPGQSGHGHINLRSRSYWHEQFSARGFICGDRIRSRLRQSDRVAPWYKFNLLDYVSGEHRMRPDLSDVVASLVASESAATSALFIQGDLLTSARNRLNHFPIRAYLRLRKLIQQIGYYGKS